MSLVREMVSMLARGILLAALLLVILSWPRQPSSWQGPISQGQGLSWQEDIGSVPRLTHQVNLDQNITEVNLNQLLPASCCVAGDRFVLVLTDQSTGREIGAILFAFAEVPSSSLAVAWSNRNDTEQRHLELQAVVNSGEQDRIATWLHYNWIQRDSAAYEVKGGVWAYKAELAADSRNALAA